MSLPPSHESSVHPPPEPLLIEPAAPGDLPAIVAMLHAAGLPHDDLASHLNTFLVGRRGGVVLGAVGAEVCGDDALLRSLIVAGRQQRGGIGGSLLDAIDRAAAGWRVRRWWLLTTTAETFFAARGFRVAERSEAPPCIQQTGQFRGGCCRSAVCMTRAVQAAAGASGVVG